MPVVISGTNGVSGVDGTASNPSYEGTDSNTGIFFPAADTIAFAEGGTEVARFDSSGNLGIGNNVDNNTRRLFFNTTSGGTSAIESVTVGATNQALVFKTTFSTEGERMRIDGAGNVGIGQAYGLTNTRLMVAGQSPGANGAYATGVGSIVLNETQRTSASDNGGFEFKTSVFGAGYGAKLIALDAGELVFANRSNSATWSERARIDSSGNLLVGATSLPTSSVSVAGVGVFNASGTAGRINLGKTASGTLDGLANYHNGTYVGGITYSNTATALVASSDERLKENIVAAPSALEKAMSIEVVSYDWKHDPTHVEFGLVAQRLNSIYSEAVNVGDDGEEVEKTWGVEYGRLTPMLLKAIQEQQQMIETLQAKVAALEAK